MQSVRVVRYKPTELQPVFSSTTAFWQDHNSATAVLLSQSKAELKKKTEKKEEEEKKGGAKLKSSCSAHAAALWEKRTAVSWQWQDGADSNQPNHFDSIEEMTIVKT